MRDLLLVFLGGGIGSMMRYLINRWLVSSALSFPLATFLVNITGCFLIGFIFFASEMAEDQTPWRLFLITGFCGGFTTFSTFSFENFELFDNQQLFILFIYIASSVILGMTAAWLGILAGKNL